MTATATTSAVVRRPPWVIPLPMQKISVTHCMPSDFVATGSQSVVLRATLDGGKGVLLPGQFVTMELQPNKSTGSWDVPLSAVAHDGDYAVVFVRTTKGFDARPVKVLASASQRLRIQGAFQANEQIAVSGIVALKGAWLDNKGEK